MVWNRETIGQITFLKSLMNKTFKKNSSGNGLKCPENWKKAFWFISKFAHKTGMFLFSFDDDYEQKNDQKRRIFSILMAFQMFSIWEDKEFHIGCWAILTPEGDTSKTFMRMVFIYNISQVEDNRPTSNSNFWDIVRWFGGKLIRLMMNLSAHNQTPLSRESANIADHFCNILN